MSIVDGEPNFMLVPMTLFVLGLFTLQSYYDPHFENVVLDAAPLMGFILIGLSIILGVFVFFEPLEYILPSRRKAKKVEKLLEETEEYKKWYGTLENIRKKYHAVVSEKQRIVEHEVAIDFERTYIDLGVEFIFSEKYNWLDTIRLPVLEAARDAKKHELEASI